MFVANPPTNDCVVVRRRSKLGLGKRKPSLRTVSATIAKVSEREAARQKKKRRAQEDKLLQAIMNPPKNEDMIRKCVLPWLYVVLARHRNVRIPNVE